MLTIGIVSGARSPVIETRELDWHGLAELVTQSHAVTDTKDGDGWVPGNIAPGPRTGDRVACWHVLALDVEADAETEAKGVKRVTGPLPPTVPEIEAELLLRGWSSAGATSHSHESPAAVGTLGPRYRLVFELSRPIATSEIRPLGLAVAGVLGIGDCIDRKCLEPARLFFFPRTPADRAHLAHRFVAKGVPLDVDALLERAQRAAEPLRKNPPPATGSVIHAFNEQADWGTLLERHGYLPHGRNRWLWPGSTTGVPGVLLLPEGGRIYSHHPGDPLSSPHGHDPFSAFTVLDHRGDTRAAVAAAARSLEMDQSARESWSPPLPHPWGVPEAQAGEAEEPPFIPVQIADVLINPQPPHPFVWGPFVPGEALTLLSAHGGVGKSGLGLQLAAHVSLGRAFLGHNVRQANSLFFSAEDAASVLRLRIAAVCQNHGIEPAALAQHLHVLDATGAAALWESQGTKLPGKKTRTYEALRAYVDEHEIAFVVVDNASDTYGAERADRTEVTRFIRALVRLVHLRGGAVLLLAHVNRATSGKSLTATENYSDSTAWHNAARSRLFMTDSEGGRLRELTHEKSNYGPLGPKLILEMLGGCGVEIAGWDQEAAADAESARGLVAAANMRVVLRMVDEFADRGESISPSPNSPGTNVWAMLRHEPEFPPALTKGELFALCRDMERAGYLGKERYTKPNRHQADRWAVTKAGRAFTSIGNASRASSAPACDVIGVDALDANGEVCADPVRQH